MSDLKSHLYLAIRPHLKRNFALKALCNYGLFTNYGLKCLAKKRFFLYQYIYRITNSLIIYLLYGRFMVLREIGRKARHEGDSKIF